MTVASRFISTRGDPRFVDVIGDLEKIQRTESNIPLHSSLTHLSAFRRSFPSKVLPDYLREHIPGKERSIGDLGAVLGREMEFSDSQQHVGLQIADALTNCVRRALIGNIQTDGWRHVRKLMINHREGSVKFITMGPRHGSIRGQPYAVVAKLLTRGERGMLTERRPHSERRAHKR